MDNNFGGGLSAESRGSAPVILKLIAGALVGSLPGIILWIVLGKIGVVAAIGGFLIMVGELFLCDKFTGGAEDVDIKIVLIICGIVMLGDIYLCERAVWAWELKDVLTENGVDAGFFDCFRSLDAFLELLEAKTYFIVSLGESYLFALLGAFGGFAKLIKK